MVARREEVWSLRKQRRIIASELSRKETSEHSAGFDFTRNKYTFV